MGPEGDRRASATARQTNDDDAITPVPELRTQAPSERTISPANRELSPEVASVRQEERSPSRWRGYFAKSGKLRPFRLLKEDSLNFRLRYISDWTVFNQLVLASAIYVFFTNILPGITFASDLYVLTGESWGTIEVVFSTGLCGIIFALFSAQPLTILGVTGPFSVLAENIYSLCENSFKIPFLPFMAWSLIHSGWMHYLLAIFNAHDYTMQYVTDFSADIFSLLNSVIYFHKAVRELERTKAAVSLAAFLYSIIGAAGTCLLAIFLSTAPSWKPLFHRYVRMGLAEYAAVISIVFFIGMPYVGDLAHLDHNRLEVSKTFRPSSPSRDVFFVEFWKLPIGWIFIAIIPGIIITVLFYFDHEISSIICTAKRYGIQKPGGYAWDIMLLGTTTIMCGILGIPPANGLLPQAPLHSESLMHTVVEDPPAPNSEPGEEPPLKPLIRVYEQRYSPFIQAAGILLFVSPPFQHVLGFTPTSVLAGLFMFMGYQSLSVNPILNRIWHLLTPISELPALPQGASWLGIHMYTISQIVLTGIVFGVTLTVAAPGFPIIIIILVPVRLFLMNKVWNRETLRYVDGWATREGKPEDNENDRRREAVIASRESARRVSDEEKGINLAFAKLLLERGCSVLIGDLALRPEASSLVSQYSPQSSSDSSRPTAHFQQTNVASWPQLSRLWDTALATFPRIDIVVPGAGIFEPAWSSFWHAPKTASNPDTKSRDAAAAEPGTYAVIDVNLTHPIRLSQLAIGHWTQTHRPGCLVHTPMWREDPDKKHMAEEEEDAKLFTEPEEIARGMLELCENPEYGNGTILEVVKGRKRVVPFYHAEPPQGDGVFIPKYKEGAEKLWDGLESEGLKV
ncbi:Hco3-transporter family protein [Colletotrichum sp. SAR 10_99]|nr:Hco3-transporter family protein [Colletotrichum sp. SAR 10_96]KAJ5013141.1 Hco3-transporter family protein [Colletotrichum sp. SAR 10_99]